MAVRPDFAPRVRAVDKRIVRRNRIQPLAARSIDVDPQDRAEQVVDLLARSAARRRCRCRRRWTGRDSRPGRSARSRRCARRWARCRSSCSLAGSATSCCGSRTRKRNSRLPVAASGSIVDRRDKEVAVFGEPWMKRDAINLALQLDQQVGSVHVGANFERMNSARPRCDRKSVLVPEPPPPTAAP